MHNNTTLKLDGSEIPVVDQYKFLGVIFDKNYFISLVNVEAIPLVWYKPELGTY